MGWIRWVSTEIRGWWFSTEEQLVLDMVERVDRKFVVKVWMEVIYYACY